MILWTVLKDTNNSLRNAVRLRGVSCCSILSLLITAFFLMGAGRGCADMDVRDMAPISPIPEGISIYALSRGTGVPEEARKILEEVRILLKEAQDQGTVTRLVDRRIGLEGETQLCAEFSDAHASQNIVSQIRKISEGVDLLNVKPEPCPQ